MKWNEPSNGRIPSCISQGNGSNSKKENIRFQWLNAMEVHFMLFYVSRQLSSTWWSRDSVFFYLEFLPCSSAWQNHLPQAAQEVNEWRRHAQTRSDTHHFYLHSTSKKLLGTPGCVIYWPCSPWQGSTSLQHLYTRKGRGQARGVCHSDCVRCSFYLQRTFVRVEKEVHRREMLWRRWYLRWPSTDRENCQIALGRGAFQKEWRQLTKHGGVEGMLRN